MYGYIHIHSFTWFVNTTNFVVCMCCMYVRMYAYVYIDVRIRKMIQVCAASLCLCCMYVRMCAYVYMDVRIRKMIQVCAASSVFSSHFTSLKQLTKKVFSF
jgi:hypothetical protein